VAWIDEYARLFGYELTEEVRSTLLDLARDVAHASERTNAPLASYLAGRYAQRRIAEGADEMTALRELGERVRPLHPKG